MNKNMLEGDNLPIDTRLKYYEFNQSNLTY